MTDPAADDLKRLRETSNLIEKMIIIKRFGYLNSRTVIYPILDAVSSGEHEIIEQAAETLLKLNKYLEPILTSEITNENSFIRWTLTLVIQNLNQKSHCNLLIPAIGCGYKPVIDIILCTLHKLDPNRFPTRELNRILPFLTSLEKDQITHYAVRQLGRDALDTTETLYALDTLRILNHHRVVVPLIKVSNHSDYRVRLQAKKILKSYDPNDILHECQTVIESYDLYEKKYDFELNYQNNPLHLYAIEQLGVIGQENLEVRKILWKIIRSGTKMERIFALRALEQLYQNSKEEIILSEEILHEINDFLSTLEGKDKLLAVTTLGRLGEEWAFASISNFLQDKDPSIRLAVINALDSSTKKNILDKVAFLLVDRDARIRHATARLFEELDQKYFQMKTSEGNVIDKMPDSVRTALLEKMLIGLKTGNKHYKIFASFWLGTLNYMPAFDSLVENLYHSSEKVVLSMIKALGILGSSKAIPHLMTLINTTKNDSIQQKAIEIIGMLGEDKEGINALIHLLFTQGDKNIPFLETYIKTFGASIVTLISNEIANERSTHRQCLLQNFLSDLHELFEIKDNNSDMLNILL